MEQGQKNIDRICNKHIGFLVENVNLEEASFPLFHLTYSLWRKAAYNEYVRLESKRSRMGVILEGEANNPAYFFFRASEGKVLPTFVDKLKEQMQKSAQTMKTSIVENKDVEKMETTDNELTIVQYGESLWKQELYVELFSDLVSAPYLQKLLLPKGNNYQIKTQFVGGKTLKSEKFVDKVVNNIGKTAVKKGLNFVTEQVVNKAIMMKLQLLIGTFNPPLMLASFGMEKLMNLYDQNLKEKNLIAKISEQIQTTNKKVDTLQKLYEEILADIESYLKVNYREEEDSQEAIEQAEAIRKKLKAVFDEDWLHYEIEKEGDWEIVKFQERQSFEELIVIEKSEAQGDITEIHMDHV